MTKNSATPRRLPAGWLATQLGYKGGIITGLTIVAAGGFWFIPATYIASFWAFLLGVSIIDANSLTFAHYKRLLGTPYYLGVIWNSLRLGLLTTFIATIVLSNISYSNPLYMFPEGPSVPLSDFTGQGSFWKGAWWFHLYWSCFALILAVFAHVLWPRGTDLGLGVRLRRMGAADAKPRR